MKTTNLGILLVALFAASTVSANPPCVEIPIPDSCAPCAGSIHELSLVNASDRAQELIIWQGDVIVFCDTIPPCETFSYYEGHWPGQVGEPLRLIVDGQPHAEIPMDCSVDVRPGMMYGEYMIVSGISNAGPLCPLPMDCPPPPPPEDCGECDGKVTALSLLNLGPAANIRVDQKKDGSVFDAFVGANEVFSFVGQDKKATLGTEISIYVDGALATKIHTSCSKPVGPGLVFGNFEVISGSSRNGGPLCPLDMPPVDSSDCECDGKVTVLSILYTGPSGDVRVEQKDGEAIFDGALNSGEIFSFRGTDKKGTMGTEITLFQNGVASIALHTSCSKPIGPGLIAGDFEVIGGESANGGPLCDVAADAQDGQTKSKKKKKKKKKSKKSKK